MGKDNLLSIGDVIQGNFLWNVWSHKVDEDIFILSQDKSIPYSPGFDPDLVRIAHGGYVTGPKSLLQRIEEAGLRLNDKKFVVTYTNMQGGGTGHGPHDVYPDGWNVTAQALKDDDTYDPNGLKIQFYQTGCFTCMIPEPDVVGKMQQIFVPTGP